MSVFDFALSEFKKMSTEEIEKGLLRSEGWGGKLTKNPDSMKAAKYELKLRSKKIKRIIAREGLIVLGIIVITRIFIIREMGYEDDRFLRLVTLFLFIYGAIRFIIWAIKTLKEKK